MREKKGKVNLDMMINTIVKRVMYAYEWHNKTIMQKNKLQKEEKCRRIMQTKRFCRRKSE